MILDSIKQHYKVDGQTGRQAGKKRFTAHFEMTIRCQPREQVKKIRESVSYVTEMKPHVVGSI